MGLNYRDHAKEASMPIPNEPVLFIKPRTALNGPSPAKINVPKIAQDNTSDYEAELTFVIGKTGKDIPKERAMEYVLGYTASNDVSARAQQFKNSQWCFAKGKRPFFFFFCCRCLVSQDLTLSWIKTNISGKIKASTGLPPSAPSSSPPPPCRTPTACASGRY